MNTSKVLNAYLSVGIPEVARQNLRELAFSFVQHFTHSVTETNDSNEPAVQGEQHRTHRRILTTSHFRQGPEFWRRQTVSVRQHSRAPARPEKKRENEDHHCWNLFSALCQCDVNVDCTVKELTNSREQRR